MFDKRFLWHLWIFLFFGFVLPLSVSVPSVAYADSLGDYKKKKHEKRKRVKQEDCIAEFIQRCESECKVRDQMCIKQCKTKSKNFCEERKKKRVRQQIGLAAKGASLAVGAISVWLDDDMPKLDPDGNAVVRVSPYTKFWNRPSFNVEFGAGLLEGGAMGLSANVAFRQRFFGFGANANYLWQGDDYLVESDVGPMFYMASKSFIAGFQPSALISQGNGVDTEYGFGLRAPTRFYSERVIVMLNPMLGRINNLWNYHLKVSVGYRLTPSVGLFGGYEYRDIVDLNDLDITTASLQGGFLYLRYNLN
ncbi:MAG: hypothetical protein VX278_14200 [Myxococcota bacterium]|nr:hypothetical protein [Myxococcota bacterium]